VLGMGQIVIASLDAGEGQHESVRVPMIQAFWAAVLPPFEGLDAGNKKPQRGKPPNDLANSLASRGVYEAK
jgi:hypothetical protein